MEVSSINHLDTHAIIGGNNATTFGVKQDAEFFEILSSTLYSMKKLAVIREVLCNSWDANIENQKSDKPVVVEVTDNKMTFTDVGKGIPRDMIDTIYCTYGGSTKKHDGKVTGGFGLGSKAPFAYASNFTVTSIHEGIKSVYNISRGTTATEGIPDLRCMVSVPTKDPSGLIVSIPIMPSDKQEFIELIKTVTYLGGMYVKLNGRILERIQYPDDIPFILVPDEKLPGYLKAKKSGYSSRDNGTDFFVKYGAVVYPIPKDFTANRHITVSPNTRLIKTFNFSVVFLAPPNSIGVTPSRETLSMTDKTIQTLKDLFSSANKFIKEIYPDVCKELVTSYKKRIHGVLANVDTFEHNLLFRILREPELGYKTLLNEIRNGGFYNKDQKHEAKVSRESIIFYMKDEYICNCWLPNEVVTTISEEDINGEKIRKLAKKTLYQNYPIIADSLYKGSFQKRDFKFYYKKGVIASMRKLVRFMKHLESKGGTVFFEKRGWDSAQYYAENIERLIADYAESDYNNKLVNIYESLFDHEKIQAFNELNIFLAPSQAAITRVIRTNGTYKTMSAYALNVVVRRKKDMASIEKHLKNVLKFKNIHLISNLDLVVKDSKILEKQYVLVLNNSQYEAHPVKEGENPEYYIYAPASYLIPGIEGPKLNQAKLKFDPVTKTLLNYLFPRPLVVPGIAEANVLEKAGKKNILEIMAKEVEEFFMNPDNHELLLTHLTDVKGYYRSWGLNIIMRYMTPNMLLEVLGKEPKYIGSDKPLPTIIVLFLHLLNQSHPPKFGFQHLHKAVAKTQDIFDGFFGKEISLLVNDPLMKSYLKHAPGYGEELSDDELAIIRSATMSALQHVRLHQQLRKKVKTL